MSITFDDLLAQAQAKAGEQAQKAEKQLGKVMNEIKDLEEKITQLQSKLAEKRVQAKELKAAAFSAVKDAIKTAEILGVEIPIEYLSMVKTSNSGNGNGNGRSKGKYYWEAYGRTPFQAEISRAMWALSAGSGGQAGKNGEGVLTVEEFLALMETQAGKRELAVGDKATVTLPNGREITVTRLE